MRKLTLILALLAAQLANAQHIVLPGSGPGSTFVFADVIPFNGVPTGPCLVNQLAQNILTGDLYDCFLGIWHAVGPGTGTVISPITSPNPFAINVDLQLCGPNPYVDVRCYGVRAVSSVPTTTASINNGSTSATLGAASTFQNGDGVIIDKAGAACGLSTPGTPTVTPSLARVGTGTGDTVPGPAGSTAYQYQFIARDKPGCLTAASVAGTTATGQASLGMQSVAISAMTRSNATVTVTTSAAHTLAVGAQVMIFTGDGTWQGTYQVATSADNTHFTFTSGQDTRTGAPSAPATLGTVYYAQGNHIVLPGAVAGAWQYYVYGRVSGSMTLLGVTHPSTFANTDLVFDDWGATMMVNGTSGIPAYVPTTPPGAAQNAPLITKIVSGAGTSTLTLADAAGATVSGNTIRFTNGPNIITACLAAQNLYWPIAASGSYVVNSLTDVVGSACGANNSWMYAGGLVLNETLIFRGNWVGDMPNAVVGGGPQFSFLGEPTVTTAANPGVFIGPNPAGFYDRLNFSGGQNPVAMDLGNVPSGPQFGQHMSFGTSGANDYMGIALLMRGSSSGNGAIRWGRVNISTGPGQQGGGFTGTSFTPSLLCQNCGSIAIDALFMNNRGMIFRPGGGPGGQLKLNWGYTQGGITPFITVAGGDINSTTGSVEIAHLSDDTTFQPFISYLPSAFGASMNVTVANTESLPGGGTPIITGPTAGWTVNGTTSGQTTNAISGSNFTDNAVSVNGVTGKAGYALNTPAAPTVAISGGVGPPAGTRYYQIYAVDAFPSACCVANSTGTGISPISPKSAPITVNGSQGVLVSWTLIPGQVTTIVCASLSPTTNAGCPDSGSGFRVTGTSYLDTGGLASNGNPPANSAGLSDGFTSGGTETQAVILTGGGFKNTISGTFTANRVTGIPDGTSATAMTVNFTTAGATTSDVVTVTGMTASGHCGVSPSNALAATGFVAGTTWADTPATNAITLHHTNTNGQIFTITCTPN